MHIPGIWYRSVCSCMFTQHFICPPILRGTLRGNHWQSAGMCYKPQQFTFKSPLSHVLGAWSMFFSKKNTENSEIMKNRKCPALMSFSACFFWAAEHLSIEGQASNLLHQISYKKQRAELAREAQQADLAVGFVGSPKWHGFNLSMVGRTSTNSRNVGFREGSQIR